MKFFKLVTFLFLLSVGFVYAQENEVKVIKYEELFDKIKQPTNQLIVVNFWATWCGPCVEEMPHFAAINEKFKGNENFKIIFVSLDRVKQLEKVKQFIKNNGINAEVVLLDDNKRMNEWIPAIDKAWSGNIPVTAFYQNNEKIHFVNSEMNSQDLEFIINNLID